MKYTKSTRYALYAAMAMAMADGPVTVGEIAETYDVPRGALAKVLQQLVRAGIATGVRGIGGGYVLAKDASEITVWDVIVVHDSPRVDAGPASGSGENGAAERLDRLFGEVSELVSCTFASVSLETLVR